MQIKGSSERVSATVSGGEAQIGASADGARSSFRHFAVLGGIALVDADSHIVSALKAASVETNDYFYAQYFLRTAMRENRPM